MLMIWVLTKSRFPAKAVMDSIEQREGRGPHKEAAMESWANARIDPRDLFASYPPIEALGASNNTTASIATQTEDSPQMEDML
jgi:hypothetical protein